MRKSIAATAVIAAAAATASCGFHRGEDGGPTVSRNYQVGAFQKIEVAGPYDVEVRTGSNPSVAGKGSEKLLEQTRGRGPRRHAFHPVPDNHKGWFHMGWHHGKAHFVVTVPQLRAATIAGSGGIKVDRVTGDSFEGTVAGSGGLLLASAEVQSLKLVDRRLGRGQRAGAARAKSAEYDIAGSGGIDAAGRQRRARQGLDRGIGQRQGQAPPAPREWTSWARATSASPAAPNARSARPDRATCSLRLKAVLTMIVGRWRHAHLPHRRLRHARRSPPRPARRPAISASPASSKVRVEGPVQGHPDDRRRAVRPGDGLGRRARPRRGRGPRQHAGRPQQPRLVGRLSRTRTPGRSKSASARTI